MQISWIETGLALRADDKYDTTEPEMEELDEKVERDAPEIVAVCQKYLSLVPVIFPTEEEDQGYTLRHRDLNPWNILINPDILQVIGILDWERVNMAPQ
ncbi:MAG: hypothetical protein MMC33_009930 [Icmadophila ericetorum]|nr:hypothetical protein [Icmadophila ericetorum]